MKKSLLSRLANSGARLGAIALSMIILGCASPKEEVAVKRWNDIAHYPGTNKLRIGDGTPYYPGPGEEISQLSSEELAELEQDQHIKSWKRRVCKLDLNFCFLQDYLSLRYPNLFGEISPDERKRYAESAEKSIFELKLRGDYLESYPQGEFSPTLRLDSYPKYEKDEEKPQQIEEEKKPKEERPAENTIQQMYNPGLNDYNNANSYFEAVQREA